MDRYSSTFGQIGGMRLGPPISHLPRAGWHFAAAKHDLLRGEPLHDDGFDSAYEEDRPKIGDSQGDVRKLLRPPMDPVNRLIGGDADLALLVQEAETRLVSAFGSGTPVIRQVLCSDDEGSASEMLFLIAQVNTDTAQALETMEKLDEGWWLDQLPRTKGKVQIGFEHSR